MQGSGCYSRYSLGYFGEKMEECLKEINPEVIKVVVLVFVEGFVQSVAELAELALLILEHLSQDFNREAALLDLIIHLKSFIEMQSPKTLYL